MKIVLVALSATLSLSSAIACSFPHRTDEELFRSAKLVFRARVTEVKLAKLENPDKKAEQIEVVEGRYEIKEVFKGMPSPLGVVRDLPFGLGNCSLGLLPGMEYVFFPEEHAMILLPSGSFAFFNAEGKEVKPRLEKLRKLSLGADK